jgi:mono/diheme cytochrome c family protein
MFSRLLLASFWFLLVSALRADTIDYKRDVKPIFTSRCAACHGALQQKAGLRLDASSLIRKGAKSGPILTPGKKDDSPLLDAVLGKDRPRMPPEKDGPPLTEKQIAVLAAWIEQGAKMPEEPIPEDPRKHWAFVAPRRPALTAIAASGTQIDVLLGAKRQAAGVTARPATARETLLRRVTIDLTGLPPTPTELQAFLAETSPDAYEKVVDRLLNSPQHGERWARHWMDVWRYSDWYGRRAVPDVWNSAPQVYRWRDWIVRSLNADHGYDRMLREMLAGAGRRRGARCDGISGPQLVCTESELVDARHCRTHRQGVSRADAQLRSLPRSQVRPNSAGRLFPLPLLLRAARAAAGPCSGRGRSRAVSEVRLRGAAARRQDGSGSRFR